MKLTIITVSYNCIDSLRETISSLQGLVGKYHDYIVIDGGSTDGTSLLLKDSAKIVTRWISEKDDGIYDAMNKGWELADSDSHIIFLGAGDKILSMPSIGSDGARSVIFGDVRLEGRGLFRGSNDWRLMFGNTLHHQALLVPKIVHPAPPFNCDYPTYADFDFNQRLKCAGVNFIRSSQLLSYAAAGGVSHRLNTEEMLKICRQNYPAPIPQLAWLYLAWQKLKSRFDG